MNTASTDEPEHTAKMENLYLRPETKEDHAFLEALHRLTRPDLLQLGLPQDLLDSMLEMQFRAQRSSYRQEFPQSENYVIELDGVAVGSLLKHVDETAIRLIYIALLPEVRGKGYGRHLVSELQRETTASGKSLLLSVDPFNVPARSLYLSLGFGIGRQDGPNVEMFWPTGGNTANCS